MHIDPWPSLQSEISLNMTPLRKKSGSNHVVHRKSWQILTSIGQSETVGSVRVNVSLQWPRATSGWVLPVKSRRSATWGLENSTAGYGQEKKKLWVNIAVCLYLPISVCLSVCLSLSLSLSRIFNSKKNKESYICINKCCGSSSIIAI